MEKEPISTYRPTYVSRYLGMCMSVGRVCTVMVVFPGRRRVSRFAPPRTQQGIHIEVLHPQGRGAHRSGQEPTWLPAFSASICCCPWQVAAAGFCGLLGYWPLSGFRFRPNQQRLSPIRQSYALLRCPFPSLLAAFGEFPLTCLPRVDCDFLQPPATDCIRHSARDEPDPLGIRRFCKLFRDAGPSAGSTPTEGPSATASELQVHARRAAIGQAAGRFCLS